MWGYIEEIIMSLIVKSLHLYNDFKFYRYLYHQKFAEFAKSVKDINTLSSPFQVRFTKA